MRWCCLDCSCLSRMSCPQSSPRVAPVPPAAAPAARLGLWISPTPAGKSLHESMPQTPTAPPSAGQAGPSIPAPLTPTPTHPHCKTSLSAVRPAHLTPLTRRLRRKPPSCSQMLRLSSPAGPALVQSHDVPQRGMGPCHCPLQLARPLSSALLHSSARRAYPPPTDPPARPLAGVPACGAAPQLPAPPPAGACQR